MTNISEQLVDILGDYGVDTVFGNPGTTEMPFVNSIEEDENIDYIMTLHEDIAVGAAIGYALKTRDFNKNPLTVVNLHSTPGLFHGSCNLYNAAFHNVPIIITTGSQKKVHETRNPALSGKRENVVSDTVKWSYRIESPEEVPTILEKAARKALTPPMGPVYIDIPYHIQKSESLTDKTELNNLSTLPSPTERAVESAAQLISESKNPVLFVGDHVAHESKSSTRSVVNLAEKLGCPVYGEVLLSSAAYPTEHEQWIGMLTLNEGPEEISTDLAIHVGCSTNTPLLDERITPYDSETKVLEIAEDSSYLNATQSDESIISHLGDACSEIAEKASSKSFDGRIEALRRDRLAKFEDKNDKDKRMSKKELAEVISTTIGDDDVIYDEGVTSGFILRNVAEYDHGQFYGGKGGGLGEGLPAAFGVAVAMKQQNRDGQVIAYIGDGAYQYYPQTQFSINRYLDTEMTVVVPDNSGYEILRDDRSEQMTSFNKETDFLQNARSYGITTHDCETPEEITSVISNDELSVVRVPVLNSTE